MTALNNRKPFKLLSMNSVVRYTYLKKRDTVKRDKFKIIYTVQCYDSLY